MLENDVSDVGKHLFYELRVGGRRLVLVDGILLVCRCRWPVLLLELVRDECVCIVNTLKENYALRYSNSVFQPLVPVVPLVVGEELGIFEIGSLDLLLEEVKLVKEHDKWLVLEEFVVHDGVEQVHALVHPVGLIVLVKKLQIKMDNEGTRHLKIP